MNNIYGIDARLWYESGVGRYVRNLVMGFDRKKLEDTIVVFLPSKAYKEVNLSNPKIRKVVADVKWHSLAEQWSFKKIVENEEIDVMHFPYFSYPLFYKKPFVITIHDLIIDHFPTGMASSLPLPAYIAKRQAYKLLVASAVKNAVSVIVPSVATKDELIDHYKLDEGKAKVIYEGFDPLIAGAATKPEFAKDFILYVGNAYPHKNLATLFDAYKKIRKNMDVDLICIGREDFFYKRLKKNEEGIKFLHNVDDSLLFHYYTNARLLVMPSLMEGFGLPILEAMNLSCPVVCSKSAALSEVGGDAVAYFDSKDSNDLAEKIEKVLQDDTVRKTLVEKGLKRSAQFSWEECVTKTFEVYESSNSLRSGK